MVKNVNTLQTEFDFENFHCVIRIANNSLFNGVTRGSSIDIDLITEKDLLPSNYENIILAAHTMEKRYFFGILKDEFLAQFDPEYLIYDN